MKNKLRDNVVYGLAMLRFHTNDPAVIEALEKAYKNGQADPQRLAILTKKEQKAFNKVFSATFKVPDWVSDEELISAAHAKASAKAFKHVQKNFPRLRSFKGPL